MPGVSIPQLIEISWSLSAYGEIAGQYLHHPTEACAHSPEQVSLVLNRIAKMSEQDLALLRARLRLAKAGRRRFWGASNQCELCRALERLAGP